MAALCTGTSYGLSNLKANDNKELIFVKLTDSAFRAIDEYNRNKVSCGRRVMNWEEVLWGPKESLNPLFRTHREIVIALSPMGDYKSPINGALVCGCF